jgi:hypothetical protein
MKIDYSDCFSGITSGRLPGAPANARPERRCQHSARVIRVNVSSSRWHFMKAAPECEICGRAVTLKRVLAEGVFEFPMQRGRSK